jgi:hypothetical protein
VGGVLLLLLLGAGCRHSNSLLSAYLTHANRIISICNVRFLFNACCAAGSA